VSVRPVGLALTVYAQATLLWVGEQFRHAIAPYYQSAPSDSKCFPKKLEDLLRDLRYLTVF